MKNLLLTILSFMLFFVAFGGDKEAAKMSGFGEITGKITDVDSGEPMMFATVALEGNSTTMNTITDIEGYYTFKPLNPGEYTVKVSSLGYSVQAFAGIVVTAHRITYNSMQVKMTSRILPVVIVKEPMIEPDNVVSITTVTSKELDNMHMSDVQDIAVITPGVVQDDNGQLLFRGSRGDATAYYVDGMRSNNRPFLPRGSISQMSVITGGLPAKYGDVTGGVVVITTKSYSSSRK